MAGAFVALSLLLTVVPLSYREAVAEGIRGTVLAPVLAMQRGSVEREGRYEDVARLRAERDSLASYLVGQAGLAQENRVLRSLLGFRERLGRRFVAAEAIPVSGPGSYGLFQLSAGARDGVRPGMPVVTAEGLLGMVQKVDARTAVALGWMHPDFRASAMTTDGEAYGIAEPGEGPGGERMLLLSPNALHTAPDSGSLIVTSGDGLTYPRGIPIGRVAASGRARGGWQRTYFVRPLVNPAEAGHVLVLGDPAPARSDRDLAAAWGVRLSGAPRADSAAAAPVFPDAAAPSAPARPAPQPARTQPQPRREPAPRRVDPNPELPGRPVFPNEPRVPEGMPPPRGTPEGGRR